VPCPECPFKEPCDRSTWNEGSEHEGETKEISLVHTCFTCFRRSFTLYGEGAYKGDLPDGCPRWHPRAGSWLDCATCEQEREALHKRHPAYDLRHEAVSVLMDGFLNGIKGGDELGTQRAIKDSSRKWAAATVPFATYKDSLNAESEARTEAVGSLVLLNLMQDSDVGAAVSKLPPNETWRFDMEQARWLEALYLSIEEHGDDADAIAREFRLLYTHGMGRRAWQLKEIDARMEQYEEWVQLIQEGLSKHRPALKAVE
jgi:hypothetical protein